MKGNGVKTGRIYIKVYNSIFIRQKFSHPAKVFLNETLYAELPKNLTICFKGTLVSLLLDTTKTPRNCLLLLNLKQPISPQLLKLQITENHLQAPKNIYIHPKPSTEGGLQSPQISHRRPKPPAIGQSVPGANGNWSEIVHFHVRTPAIIHKIFETNSSFLDHIYLLLIITSH